MPRPTLDVNGLWSGWSGPGPKTIMPAKAGGKHDDGLHAPNERFGIEMFQRGIDTAIVYLEELAQL